VNGPFARFAEVLAVLSLIAAAVPSAAELQRDYQE
jgi:hypothetical protein